MPAPQSGIITFFFTDIEGSTRLWEQFPDPMKVAVARHDAILRNAIEKNGGYVFKIAGDAFYSAFTNAFGALSASVDVQRAMSVEQWGETGPLRVRIAIYTGFAEMREGDYFGPPLNRVSRLLSAGHGGQVLFSASTLEAIGNQLLPGVTWRDLGEHRLRGVIRPERVYQLVIQGLPSDFPPLRTLESLDAHYETIIKAFTEGRVVPFLGEEVNLCNRPTHKKWKHGQSDMLPNSSEVAEHLAHHFEYPRNAPLDLPHVSQYISVVNGSGPLYEELHSLFDVDYQPTPLHQCFASLPVTLREKGYRSRYPLIVTTNYDDALERAFRAINEPFDLVTYVAEGEQRGKFLHWTPDGEVCVIERPNEYRGLSLEKRSVILKIHGAVDRASAMWDSFVITEDHYINYLTRTDISNLLPVTLVAKLRKSHFLFLGYSLRDWNLRVILHRIWGEQKLTYKSWAIQGKLELIDRDFWRKREVDVFNVLLEDYIAGLGERVKELPQVGDGT
jgi:class 3 adenylate cyclase